MLAKKQTMSIVCLAMLTAALLASTCLAAEGETVKVQGVVSVVKDDTGAITSVQLSTDQDTYDVELDENGKELGEMDGMKVEVEGTVAEKDGQKWLTVLTFAVVE